MRPLSVLTAGFLVLSVPALASEECNVPSSFTTSDYALDHVARQLKTAHRLTISVIGTGSSTLPGPDGPSFAYPARLQVALREMLPGNEVNVIARIQARRTTADMVVEIKRSLTEDRPSLIVWQAGTFDALSGVEPDTFSANLDSGIQLIMAGEADVDLVNMQYSPRTESMLNVTAYADVMHWAAQQHGILLFDRLAIMRYWNEEGTFDLYAPTKKYDMARRVHECIGRAMAAQIVNAARPTQ